MYLEEINKWLDSNIVSEEDKNVIRGMSDAEQADAFSGYLKFGTAGLRGVMAPGTNRMNIYVVKKATQGVADYLNDLYEEPSVVISYDSRLNSRLFAESAACVLAANGIKTYLYSEMMPVPVLSYSVRELKCDAGIMITASHNPKEYNGYKVYNGTGGQILDKEADDILKMIENVDIFGDVKSMSLDEALYSCCSYVDEAVYEKYISVIDESTSISSERELNIVYTPLNGSGTRPVQEILTKNGFEYFVVPEQEEGDGNFPTCPYPNPEKREVYDVAIKYAEEKDADIILATDPDCDRVGAMIKHNGEYELLTGNQIGILLFNYICNAEKRENLKGRNLCTTIVSTPFVDQIANEYDINVIRTLVGFKYLGQQIDIAPEKFIFGFEESNGYLAGTHARDKDGVVGAKLVCQMAAFFKSKGKTAVDVLNELYDKYGYVVDKTVTVEVKTKDDIAKIMDAVRNTELLNSVFTGIVSSTDYKDREQNKHLPIADVFELHFDDKARMIIRPSGTEPKVKVYLSACNKTKEESEARIAELQNKFNEMNR